MTYRNHEGYPDPTAGEALANIRREERAMKKANLPGAAMDQAAEQPHKQKKKRPPRSEQRAKQKANKAKGRSLVV
jgi:hypothetical protein